MATNRRPGSRPPGKAATDRYDDAIAHLKAAHPALKRVISVVGPCTLRTRRDMFAALVNTVISQQISVRAADTIAARLEVAGGGRLTADAILALSPEAMRGCGLSGGKQRAIRAIAGRAL